MSKLICCQTPFVCSIKENVDCLPFQTQSYNEWWTSFRGILCSHFILAQNYKCIFLETWYLVGCPSKILQGSFNWRRVGESGLIFENQWVLKKCISKCWFWGLINGCGEESIPLVNGSDKKGISEWVRVCMLLLKLLCVSSPTSSWFRLKEASTI